MFRFSCFHSHIPSNRTKKTVRSSPEALGKAFQDGSQIEVCKDSSILTRSNPSTANAQVHKQMNGIATHSNWDSVERSCRSEELNSQFSFHSEKEVQRTTNLKKSQSLQSGLYNEGRHADNLTEGDTVVDFSCNGSKSPNESTISICRKDNDANSAEKSPNYKFEFQANSDLANVCSIFSIGDRTPSDKDAHDISDTPLSGELAGGTVEHFFGPGTPSLRRSHSLPNIRGSEPSSGEHDAKWASSISRSSEDLRALCMRKKEVFTNEADDRIKADQERENTMRKNPGSPVDSYYGDDGFDSYMLSGSAIDWVMPVRDDTFQQARSSECLEEYTNEDFNIKRIENWVIGLQLCEPPPEETNDVSETTVPLVEAHTINDMTAAVVDHKTNPEMEAAKRYISSLSANATAAQLANHGLVQIPFMSAFVTLKVLNLSGNSIARITAGALPRGLHILNLSRNNISSIEGLRELTRLRVLDLSYNRILRIGHGLASCSSLKELYLAGNKISEVEGMHRLLKLTILDLRFNKISTAKCLGQLAANYNSLQAISLEGNPAQKNVGDEQLKKYLQTLLPKLIYYNRQPMKVSSSKDGADRSVRLGLNSHQLDRSHRSDRKTTRKSNHGVVASRRPSTPSTHARRGQIGDTPRVSRSKQGYLPPIRNTKVSTESRFQFDVPSTVPNKALERGIQKSRSEGTLGAFMSGSSFAN